MDNIPPTERSVVMSKVRSKNTGPELVVRKLLRELGHVGYRLHRNELPCKPDIVFVRKRKVIFVHGCFWHNHNCRDGQRQPKSNRDYWIGKIRGNQQRDEACCEELSKLGWSVMTVWGCEIQDRELLLRKLDDFLARCKQGS